MMDPVHPSISAASLSLITRLPLEAGMNYIIMYPAYDKGEKNHRPLFELTKRSAAPFARSPILARKLHHHAIRSFALA